MPEINEGGCVCKAIRYRVKGAPIRSYACHCTFCQRFTASAFAMMSWFAEENVEIVGDGVMTYEHTVDETDRWFRLHSCNRCGTTFLATGERQPGICFIMVGTFDDPNWIKLDRQIWVRSAQHWVVLPENMERFEKGAMPPPTAG